MQRLVETNTALTEEEVVEAARGERTPFCHVISCMAGMACPESTAGVSLTAGEPEGAALGVAADRPLLAWVDDLTAEFRDAGERLGDVGDGEVGKREAVAGTWPALVQPERNSACVRLTAAPLPLLALGEREAQQLLPKAASALWVVCGKLDERELDHAAMVAPLIVVHGCRGSARPQRPLLQLQRILPRGSHRRSISSPQDDAWFGSLQKTQGPSG